MNNKTVPLDYTNALMYELEKAFWDERGKGARFRMMNVGQQYYADKIKPLLQNADVEEIIRKVDEVLKGEGVAAEVSYSKEDRLLRVSVKGCIHRQVEERMIAREIEPFTCVPANLIVMALEEKLDVPVELAEIKVVEGSCQFLLVMFEKRPSLD
jgi:hypothetical protein